MKRLIPRGLFAALLLTALPARPAGSPPPSAPVQSEEKLIQALYSPDPEKVTDALDRLADNYPNSTNAVPVIKGLLKKPRERRRAAVTLAKYHATLELDDVKLIIELLRAYDANEVMDGLKSLRALDEPDAIVQVIVTNVLPLLDDTDVHILRDTCRTLAVLGNKDAIPALKPLLKNKHSDVRKDAQDAITKLEGKS